MKIRDVKQPEASLSATNCQRFGLRLMLIFMSVLAMFGCNRPNYIVYDPVESEQLLAVATRIADSSISVAKRSSSDCNFWKRVNWNQSYMVGDRMVMLCIESGNDEHGTNVSSVDNIAVVRNDGYPKYVESVFRNIDRKIADKYSTDVVWHCRDRFSKPLHSKVFGAKSNVIGRRLGEYHNSLDYQHEVYRYIVKEMKHDYSKRPYLAFAHAYDENGDHAAVNHDNWEFKVPKQLYSQKMPKECAEGKLKVQIHEGTRILVHNPIVIVWRWLIGWLAAIFGGIAFIGIAFLVIEVFVKMVDAST